MCHVTTDQDKPVQGSIWESEVEQTPNLMYNKHSNNIKKKENVHLRAC